MSDVPAPGQPGMTEAALAEIRVHNGMYGLDDATNIIDELLVEVERLQERERALDTQLYKQAFDLRMQWGKEAADRIKELAPDVLKEAVTRTVAAERARDSALSELADLRARLGPPEVQWTVALDGKDSSPLPEKLARRMAGDRRVKLKTRTAYKQPPWREIGDNNAA